MEENRLYQGAAAIPVSDMIILPETTSYIVLSKLSSKYRQALTDPNYSCVAVPLRGEGRESDPEGWHHLGVTIKVKDITETGKGVVIEAETGGRVRIHNITFGGDLVYAEYTAAPEIQDMDEKMEGEMLDYLKDIVREVSSHFQGSEQYLRQMDQITSVNSMIVWMGRYVSISSEERYEFLKMDSRRERSLHFMDTLLKQREAVDWNIELNERISEKTNKFYRDQVLREQLKAIKKELGEDNAGAAGKKDYKTRIEEAGMPDEIRQAALEQLDKLNAQPQGSAEVSVIQNYLDFMLALPWKREQAGEMDLKNARQILDDDHYGLDKVKKRIIEHLAVMKLRRDNKGSILLLVGPPGTGKTSLGKSIARALGRKYIRLSLGGVRDEAEIRGHRRTYVGAMPGRILQSIRQAGTTDPVMVLDEVDKLMTGGFSGDPASALLEVLDPEQNSTFTDHYLDLPYDLSDVFFIATANSLDTIPGPLLDRMEVIQISSYTEEEKFHIAREHLIGEVLEETGLKEDQLQISDEALRAIISDYTMEGGVRGLKKALLTIARAVSAQIVTEEADGHRTIGKDDLDELLGRKVSLHERAQDDNPPGVVTGLAWTPVGGEILFIEAASMPGSGQVILTGQLGDVMQESARISLSLLKSRFPLQSVNFKEKDIHIHVPSGSVPKDGPSAGITMFTALASLFTGRKVDPHLAMTGEITLRGAVMPIGGLKEKLLAARRAGITRALIPEDNLVDLKDLPQDVREQMTITPVKTIEDVLREALGISLPSPEQLISAGNPSFTGNVLPDRV